VCVQETEATVHRNVNIYIYIYIKAFWHILLKILLQALLVAIRGGHATCLTAQGP
jgi:hypothetical protein